MRLAFALLPLAACSVARPPAANRAAVTIRPEEAMGLAQEALASRHAGRALRDRAIHLPAESVRYGFDAVDNINSATSSVAGSPADVGAYQYDPSHPNAAARAGSLAMSYDAAGHLVQRGDKKLTWDALGRLSQVDLADGTAKYQFGGGNDRALAEDPHAVTHYISPEFDVQDGLGVIYARLGRRRVARLVAEDLAAKLYPDKVADGKITAGDAWLADSSAPVERMLLSSARRLLYEELPHTTFFGHDHLDSATVELDDQGQEIGRRGYYAFGSERGSLGDRDRYGFSGQEEDAGGSLHFGFRELDPGTARWTSADPFFAATSDENVDSPGEASTSYAYVANDPANAVDNTGLYITEVDRDDTHYTLPAEEMLILAQNFAALPARAGTMNAPVVVTAARVSYASGTRKIILGTNMVWNQLTREHRNIIAAVEALGGAFHIAADRSEHAEDVIHNYMDDYSRSAVTRVVERTYGRRGMKAMCYAVCQPRAEGTAFEWVVHGSGLEPAPRPRAAATGSTSSSTRRGTFGPSGRVRDRSPSRGGSSSSSSSSSSSRRRP